MLDFIGIDICKPTFDYMEEVLTVQKHHNEQLEAMKKIIELQTENVELKEKMV